MSFVKNIFSHILGYFSNNGVGQRCRNIDLFEAQTPPNFCMVAHRTQHSETSTMANYFAQRFFEKYFAMDLPTLFYVFGCTIVANKVASFDPLRCAGNRTHTNLPKLSDRFAIKKRMMRHNE
jgi:hypothetical protein